MFCHDLCVWEWNFKFESLLNDLPHVSQVCGFSPVWTRTWFRKFPFWWNPFPHISHWKSFSVLWIFIWVFSVEDLLNALLQNWHLCGLSAVWMILCLHNVLDKRNPLPHMLQTKGLVFVWSGMRKCMVSVYFVLNTLWHCKHWYFGSIPRSSIPDKLPIVEVDSVGLGTLSFLPEKLIIGVSSLKVLLASLSSSNWAAASKVSILLGQSSLGL